MTPTEHPRLERRRGVGCLVAAMILVSFLGGLGFLLAGLGAGAGDGDRVRVSSMDRVPGARRHVAWIQARGILLEGGAGLGEGPGITRDTLALLERATIDSTVAAVVLELDTPGGSVTDADRIHRQLGLLKAAGKKVIVLMGDLCASGGLYAAVAADRILAMPTTVTGSIGVIISGLNVADLLAQHGVKDTSITSGPNKALLSPTLPVDPAHTEILKGIVDAMYQRFVKLVSEGRGLTLEQVKAVGDGRLLTAEQALAAHLIDEIGYPEDAMRTARELAGTEPLDVMRYEIEPTLIELLKSQARPPVPAVMLLANSLSAPRAMYLLSPLAVGQGLGGLL